MYRTGPARETLAYIMRHVLFILILFCLTHCQYHNEPNRIYLTGDISINFPDSVTQNQNNGNVTSFNDSFIIIANVENYEEKVSLDTANHNALDNGFIYIIYKLCGGQNISSTKTILNEASIINFEFQSLEMKMFLPNGENLINHHKGMIIRHKKSVVVVDFVCETKYSSSIQDIQSKFFSSLKIN